MIIAKETVRQIRQGDVLLTRVAEPPGAAREVIEDEQGLLVPGERTGHAHRLPARVHRVRGLGRVLEVTHPTVLTHEEHEHIEVPTGWWIPTIQREYVPRRAPRSRSRVD